MTRKIILWYIVGCVVWLLMFSLLMATDDLLIQIGANFATLTAGVLIGLSFGSQFVRKRPWIAALVPILHMAVLFF